MSSELVEEARYWARRHEDFFPGLPGERNKTAVVLEKLADRIEALEQRLAAAELNAARYEWLRLHLSDDSGVNTKEGWMPIAYEGPEGTDAAIDAARGKP